MCGRTCSFSLATAPVSSDLTASSCTCGCERASVFVCPFYVSCMHVCIHVCMHVCMHACMPVYQNTDTCMYPCVCTCVCVCVCVCVYAHVCSCVRSRKCACVHMHRTHARMHARTHTSIACTPVHSSPRSRMRAPWLRAGRAGLEPPLLPLPLLHSTRTRASASAFAPRLRYRAARVACDACSGRRRRLRGSTRT